MSELCCSLILISENSYSESLERQNFDHGTNFMGTKVDLESENVDLCLLY